MNNEQINEQINELQKSLRDILKNSNIDIAYYIRLFENEKQVALEKIIDILGGLCYISDRDVCLHVETQLETMIKCITLNENYTNLKRSYMSFELPSVYFELKKAYKDFDRSHWMLLAYRILEKYK